MSELCGYRFWLYMKGWNDMWKRLIIICLALIGTFSVGYAYYNVNMNASGATYASGGNVTGRINMSPNGISGSNIGIQKGDKFYSGIKNPKNNEDLGFMLILYNENLI